MNKTIKGHQAKIEELKKELPADSQLKLEITKVQIVEKSARSLTLKGGLAGGAALFAADYLMPMGPVFLGGEIGYAIGSGFGIIDAGAKVLYPVGNFNVGLELAYAGYSKDVTNVPGLSGVIKSWIGFGIVGCTKMGPVQVGLGYNTGLGLRVDAGYRYYL
ncbi:MAG: hypothetical protein HY753_05280 [Nitrospirae bacterium]|nr:hypothetical protein [Nitrospirota bacterium]